MESTKELVDALLNSEALQQPVVSFTRCPGLYFNREYVIECIEELKGLENRLIVDPGSPMTKLERLALEVLLAGLGVDLPTPTVSVQEDGS